jgi:hypothetical protein
VDVTCLAVSLMNTSELHERLCASFKLLAGRLATPGVANQRSWLPQDRLIQGLVRRGLRLWWRQEGGIWQDFRTTHAGRW